MTTSEALPAHLLGMTLSIHSPDELVAAIPHLLGFKLFWTTCDGGVQARATPDVARR